MFTSILTLTQDCPPGQVDSAPGSCCLALDDECWYRAEIVHISQDSATATLFLLDYGKKIKSSLTSLRPLPKELVEIPGLVYRVGLHGIKPVGEDWSEEEIGGTEIVLDVGNDVTQFTVKVVQVDSKVGEVLVSMNDMEGTDVTSLLVETGIAAAADVHVDSQELMNYPAGSLALGKQTLMVLSALSPMEFSLCTEEMFMQLSTCMTLAEEVAASSSEVTLVKTGVPVLACDEGTWYRARGIDCLADYMVKVELVDLASFITTKKDSLRNISPELMKQPVVALSCCLDSWVGEDETIAIEKWGTRMVNMMEQYSEVEVEVVGQMESGKYRVTLPELEKKLKEGDVKSRAEMLKDKLR